MYYLTAESYFKCILKNNCKVYTYKNVVQKCSLEEAWRDFGTDAKKLKMNFKERVRDM